MNLYYMTSLCPDVDIDRKILRSGVRVDRKLLHLVRIVCSAVDIDLTMYLHVKPVPRCLYRSKNLTSRVCSQMLISIINAFLTPRDLKFVSHIQGISTETLNCCCVTMTFLYEGFSTKIVR